MIPVIIETPYASAEPAQIEKHLGYLRACMRDCLLRGEAPFASHALYTQPGVLDDLIPEERRLGIEAGFEWKNLAKKTVVYTNFGISPGMTAGIEHAKVAGHPIEYRTLEVW